MRLNSHAVGRRILSYLPWYFFSARISRNIPKYISNNFFRNFSSYITSGHLHSEVYLGKSADFYDSVVAVGLRDAIFPKYWGCWVWTFAAFCQILFQLAVSPFNWIDKITEDVSEKVGRILTAKAFHDWTVEGQADKIKVMTPSQDLQGSSHSRNPKHQLRRGGSSTHWGQERLWEQEHLHLGAKETTPGECIRTRRAQYVNVAFSQIMYCKCVWVQV